MGAVAVGALIGTAIYVAVETKKNSTKIENLKYFDSAQEAADWWGQQLENQFISDNKFAGVEYGAHIYRKKVNGRFVYYIDRTYSGNENSIVNGYLAGRLVFGSKGGSHYGFVHYHPGTQDLLPSAADYFLLYIGVKESFICKNRQMNPVTKYEKKPGVNFFEALWDVIVHISDYT